MPEWQGWWIEGHRKGGPAKSAFKLDEFRLGYSSFKEIITLPKLVVFIGDLHPFTFLVFVPRKEVR